MQEVFLRLWNDPTRFDPDRGALRSYLLTQAHGRSIDALRSGTARRAREGRDAVARSDVKNVEDAVIDLSTAVSVKRAVDLLPDDERQAIDLAYFGGHSYREVAVLLSQPEGTIKSRIRSGLKRLREQLTAEGATQVWAQ